MSGKIYKALADVMSDIRGIGKDQYNQMQRYKYRGIDDIYNHLQPILRKHRVFILPEVLETEREERKSKRDTLLLWTIARVKYTFATDDGSSLSVIFKGEAMDSGDKGVNKAVSAAQKYTLVQMFCIPTGELPDSEVDSPIVKYEPRDIENKSSLSPQDVPVKNKSVSDPANIPLKDASPKSSNKQSTPHQSDTDSNIDLSCISKDYYGYKPGTKYKDIPRSFKDENGKVRGLYSLRAICESAYQDMLGTEESEKYKRSLYHINEAIKYREGLEEMSLESYKNKNSRELLSIFSNSDETNKKRHEALKVLIEVIPKNISRYKPDFITKYEKALSIADDNIFKTKEIYSKSHNILKEFSQLSK